MTTFTLPKFLAVYLPATKTGKPVKHITDGDEATKTICRRTLIDVVPIPPELITESTDCATCATHYREIIAKAEAEIDKIESWNKKMAGFIPATPVAALAKRRSRRTVKAAE